MALPYLLYFLKGYNNYKNRQVKFGSSLTDYTTDYTYSNPMNATGNATAPVDFNENDGVEAECVVNWSPATYFEPDYMIVVTNDDNKTIVSRWFVMEWVRTRSKQYHVTLRRDVIADNWNSLQSVPLFVEKGILSEDNPLIYTKENLEVNQIKKSEVLLKDSTSSAWIVGYYNAKLSSSASVSVPYEVTGDVVALNDLQLYFDSGSTTHGKLYKKTGRLIYNSQAVSAFYLDHDVNHTDKYIFKTLLDDDGSNASTGYSVTLDIFELNYPYFTNKFNHTNPPLAAAAEKINETIGANGATIVSDLHTYLGTNNNDFISASNFQKIRNSQTLIYDTDTSKYYKISLTAKATTTKSITCSSSVMSSSNAIGGLAADNVATIGVAKAIYGNPFSITYIQVEYEFTLIDVTADHTAQSYTTTISATAQVLQDAPYRMFFMKYDEFNLSIAQQAAIELGANLYDLQILPYCPDTDAYNNYINSRQSSDEGKLWNEVKDASSNVVSYLIYAKTSSGSFFIPYTLEIQNKKIENQCDFVRIVSPNYNGAYSFIPAKNDGINGFNVYYTYKPYTPYIQVSPFFGGLYGDNYDDARGLICNGDFSVATISESWKTYENNNKNYQNIFNANIKTNDFNNAVNVATSVASMGADLMKGAAKGALSGTGVAGAAVGLASSAVKSATSLIGGQAIYRRKRQNEIDQFGYEIGNIKAQPDTLNKVSAYNINNKYFPFLEFYSCTDEEKEVLKNKIKYNGMTVMIIGTISDFVSKRFEGLNYFQARFVTDTANNLKCDSHMVDAIDEELQNGLYIL